MYLFIYKLFFMALRCAPSVFFVVSVVTSLVPEKTSVGQLQTFASKLSGSPTVCSLACPANLAVGLPADGSISVR